MKRNDLLNVITDTNRELIENDPTLTKLNRSERRAAKKLARAQRERPDASDEAAFNTAATEIGVVFTRSHEDAIHLDRVICLTCGETWPAPKHFRVQWAGWHQATKRHESPPRSELSFKFNPDVQPPFRCPKGCNAPEDVELPDMATAENPS